MCAKQSDLLAEYLARWKEFDSGCRYIHSIFNYLNNHWIKNRIEDSRQQLSGHSSLYAPRAKDDEEIIRPIYPLCLFVWKQGVFDKLKKKLNYEILQLVRKEREGERVEQDKLANIIYSYVRLGLIDQHRKLAIYVADFEGAYVASVRNYYEIVSSNFISERGMTQYLIHAEKYLLDEENRAKRILDATSLQKVVSVCNATLLTAHREKMYNEVKDMLENSRLDDLKLMFQLLSRIEDGLLPMMDLVEEFITNLGMSTVQSLIDSGTFESEVVDAKRVSVLLRARRSRNASIPVAAGQDLEKGSTSSLVDVAQIYVETLLKLHGKFYRLVTAAFGLDAHFVSALDKALTKVVNGNALAKDSSKSPELLARYTDFLLNKGNKKFDETEIEQKLSQVILIFKYIDDKDVFQTFYSKMLTKRLIHGTSISEDAEKVMISSLKDACGFEYTSKLQRMFNDVQLSVEVNENFKEVLANSRGAASSTDVELSVTVLTSGSWPLFGSRTNFVLPSELRPSVAAFQGYYDSLHPGRRLSWLYQLSKADIKMTYTKRRYEIQATVFQLGVLLLFNKTKSISDKDMNMELRLEPAELKRTLRSLLEAKLLRRNSDGLFFLNPKFVSKRNRFKITSRVLGESSKESDETRRAILDDRRVFLQAAIVRIMKSRTSLPHNELISEVLSQSRSRFQPNIQMIKRVIEQLIEKEYIARKDEGNVYVYLA
eukprot:TRINITY_DN2443_c0_g1_i2.p1 TRINITY_DN2443_c0_g1~~TRINITY_DN2443_c0_g1_i2.p1  ORF type:complete len:789 (+),score=134.70 TRINITY_DN2443_c0_g1_i2:226-2367(+)